MVIDLVLECCDNRPMNKKNYTLSVQAASALLAASLGDTADRWTTKLNNWRKPDRVSPLTWSVDTPRPRYDESELSAFIEGMQRNNAVLALPHADPTDDLPRVQVLPVRNADGRHLVQLQWQDANASSTVALSAEAAHQLHENLGKTIAALEAGSTQDFENSMSAGTRAYEIRAAAVGTDGELPSLAEALEKARGA